MQMVAKYPGVDLEGITGAGLFDGDTQGCAKRRLAENGLAAVADDGEKIAAAGLDWRVGSWAWVIRSGCVGGQLLAHPPNIGKGVRRIP